jgi:hypothetical protein
LTGSFAFERPCVLLLELVRSALLSLTLAPERLRLGREFRSRGLRLRVLTCMRLCDAQRLIELALLRTRLLDGLSQ